MRFLPSLLVVSLLVPAAGCSRGADSPAPGIDGGPRVGDGRSTPAPDGVGVCCPMDSPCIGPTANLGGWAADDAACAEHLFGGYDGGFDMAVDAHGCGYWIDRGTTTTDVDLCCGCVPPTDGGPPDGGPVSLEGDYACGAMTCGTGEVCVYRHGGADTGMPTIPSCQTLPEGCGELHACGFAPGSGCCSPADRCAREICRVPECAGGFSGVYVEGRSVNCGGA